MRRIFIVFLCLCLVVLPVFGSGGPKYVALTFDDGPSGKYTRQLLQGLRRRSVKATFALCGYRMEQYPDLAQRIWEEGHEIICHGFSHGDMRAMSRRELAAEIQAMEALLPPGCAVSFLRPPGGASSPSVVQVARARNLSILSWSVDPRDWATRDPWQVEKAVLDRVTDGDVILLHDMSDSSVQAALDIVDTLKERGFRFVTVSELARLRGCSLKAGVTYIAFPPREETVK